MFSINYHKNTVAITPFSLMDSVSASYLNSLRSNPTTSKKKPSFFFKQKNSFWLSSSLKWIIRFFKELIHSFVTQLVGRMPST